MRNAIFALGLLAAGSIAAYVPSAQAGSIPRDPRDVPLPVSSEIGVAFIGCISSAIDSKNIEEANSLGVDSIQFSCRGRDARALYSALMASHPAGDYNKSGYIGKIASSRTALCVELSEHNGVSVSDVMCVITIGSK